MSPGVSAAIEIVGTFVLPPVLAVAAAWHALGPLWRRAGGGFGGPVERARLIAELEAALRAVGDLTFDHATGKIRDEDYQVLRARQEAAAIRALRQLEARIEQHPE